MSEITHQVRDSCLCLHARIFRNTSGIYLLVHAETGKQYVGAAYGGEGFWGRWQSYLDTGHGGNVALKRLGLRGEDLQLTVLETAPSSASFEQIIQIENAWKEKLGSRVIGLNIN